MKKVILISIMMLFASLVKAQTMTDANGGRIYRGNIAVIVKESIFSLDQNGNFVSNVSEQDRSMLGALFNTLVVKHLQNEGFRIVNRDNEAYDEVAKILAENKLEDYLKGYSVQAKGLGADAILLVDISLMSKGREVEANFSYRLMSVTNNTCYPVNYHNKHEYSNEADFKAFMKQIIDENNQFFLDFMRTQYPVMFSIESASGKKATLSALQPVGALRYEDKIYFYEYSKEKGKQDKTMEYDVLDLVAVSESFELNKRGLLAVKVDGEVKKSDNIVVSLSEKMPLVSEQILSLAYKELEYDEKSFDGYAKKLINQAIYGAIGANRQFRLIELNMIDAVKSERDLQKTEEFIDGYTVEQFQSVGASYYVTVSDFEIEGTNVKFNVNMYDIESNSLLKSVECASSLQNINHNAKVAMSSFFVIQAEVLSYEKKQIDIVAPFGIWADVGQKFYLAMVKEDKKTGAYRRENIAELNYLRYRGMAHSFIVKEVLDEATMKNLKKYIGKAQFTILEVPGEISEETKNEKARNGKKGGLGKFLNTVIDAAVVNAATENERMNGAVDNNSTTNQSNSKVDDEVKKMSNQLKNLRIGF